MNLLRFVGRAGERVAEKAAEAVEAAARLGAMVPRTIMRATSGNTPLTGASTRFRARRAENARYTPHIDIQEARRIWASDTYASEVVNNIVDFAAGCGARVIFESEKWQMAADRWSQPERPPPGAISDWDFAAHPGWQHDRRETDGAGWPIYSDAQSRLDVWDFPA